MTTFFTIYGIGCFVALILVFYHAYLEEKRGESISDFPAMVCPIVLMSWVYVYIFFKKYLPNLK